MKSSSLSSQDEVGVHACGCLVLELFFVIVSVVILLVEVELVESLVVLSSVCSQCWCW